MCNYLKPSVLFVEEGLQQSDVLFEFAKTGH